MKSDDPTTEPAAPSHITELALGLACDWLCGCPETNPLELTPLQMRDHLTTHAVSNEVMRSMSAFMTGVVNEPLI